MAGGKHQMSHTTENTALPLGSRLFIVQTVLSFWEDLKIYTKHCTCKQNQKVKKKLSIIARKACLFQAIPSPSPTPTPYNLSKKNSCTGGSFSLHCDKKKVKKFASSAEKTQGTAALLKI